MRRTYMFAALLAAGTYVADGALQLAHTQPDHDWSGLDRVIEAVFAVALLTSVIAVPAISRAAATSRAGSIGQRLARVGFAALGIDSVASLIHGGNVLGALFLVGLAAVLVGRDPGSGGGTRRRATSLAAGRDVPGFPGGHGAG